MSPGFLARRLAEMLVIAFGVLVVTFSVSHFLGDPADSLAPEGADPAQVNAIRVRLGLDRPALEQFGTYVGDLLHGDLGTSFAQRRPVATLIKERIEPTLLLMASALVVSSPLGVFLGIAAARRSNGVFDGTARTAAIVAYAIPSFWLAQIAILILSSHSGLLPLVGMTDAHVTSKGFDHAADVARHLVLPTLVLAASEIALLMRVTRAGVLQQLGTDYVRAARGRGVPHDTVLSRHALPNALLPVITIIGARIGFFFGGAVLVETVFAWPGLGTLLTESARARDEPVVLGMVLLAAVAIMLANLITDVAYAWIDPRVRYE